MDDLFRLLGEIKEVMAAYRQAAEDGKFTAAEVGTLLREAGEAIAALGAVVEGFAGSIGDPE